MAEDKERMGLKRKGKRKRRKICAISFLPVVSFQMEVVRKVLEEGRIKGDEKTVNRLPSAM